MKFKSKSVVFLFGLFVVHSATAQISTSDLNFAKSLIKENTITYKTAKKQKAVFLFTFYKSFISSQDIPNICQFHPSCSAYGLGQVQKNGYLLGSFATFDRLTRCNGLQTEQLYNYNADKAKFVDLP